MLISTVGPGVINESGSVVASLDFVRPELNLLQTVLRHFASHILVGDIFVLAHCLYIQGGKEVAITISHDEHSSPKGTIGV